MILLKQAVLRAISGFFFSRVGKFFVSRVNISGAAHGLGRLADASANRFLGLDGKQIAERIRSANITTSELRRDFPLEPTGAKAVVVLCMDCRLDVHEITGNSTPEIFCIRVAGGIMTEEVQEMILLAVEHGAKYIFSTTHTDCAAEKADPERLPALCSAVAKREAGLKQLLSRQTIQDARRTGRLHLEVGHLDTRTGAILSMREL